VTLIAARKLLGEMPIYLHSSDFYLSKGAIDWGDDYRATEAMFAYRALYSHPDFS
jgi:hypothetical protein